MKVSKSKKVTLYTIKKDGKYLEGMNRVKKEWVGKWTLNKPSWYGFDTEVELHKRMEKWGITDYEVVPFETERMAVYL